MSDVKVDRWYHQPNNQLPQNGCINFSGIKTTYVACEDFGISMCRGAYSEVGGYWDWNIVTEACHVFCRKTNTTETKCAIPKVVIDSRYVRGNFSIVKGLTDLELGLTDLELGLTDLGPGEEQNNQVSDVNITFLRGKDQDASTTTSDSDESE